MLRDNSKLTGTLSILPGVLAHRSGALLLEESRTAILADVHLGYGWAQRRRGELGPLADEQTRRKLLALSGEWKPRRIVFLGDLVHAPRPCAPERAWIEDLLLTLHAKSEVVCVRGNHDRAFARDFANLPITQVEQWTEGTLIALHGDRLPPEANPQGVLVLGHVHPAIPLRDAAGAGRKLPVFLATPQCILLPAFSPFAGGYDLLSGVPTELCPLFGTHRIEAYAASETRLLPLGPLDRALNRIVAVDTGAPKRFRTPARLRRPAVDVSPDIPCPAAEPCPD